MANGVFFGSAKQSRLEAKESLPAKLDLILEKLGIKDRVKGEHVALKMHTGNNLGYSTIHPVFIRKVVKAIKDGGGKPFVVDVSWDAEGSEERGYSAEVLGCPVYPSGGPANKYFYTHNEVSYKNICSWNVAGVIQDASFLVNFSHIKGHPSCGFGGAFKNIALGCMAGETRGAIHDCMHFDKYWFPEKCPDNETRELIKNSCPFEAIVSDKENPEQLHLHMEQCNQCLRCIQVAPKDSLKIDPTNFHSFQEACAIAVQIVLSTFKPENAIHLSLATFMTPVCDCFGFTTMPILPDIGIFGSNDIVAIDKAVLDLISHKSLIEENLPSALEVHTRKGHPFQWLHGPLKDPYVVVNYGEQLGLGSGNYELLDVYPLAPITRSSATYIPAQ
jgi:uncharacterized Fe-S center protein